MTIVYKDIKEIDKQQITDLFLSVKWDSARFPDKLQKALENSHCLYTAWDDEKLVGLINCLSDGEMTAYIHYMLVNPDYQGLGIGKKLMDMILDTYKDCTRKVLVAYDEVKGFYEKCGYKVGEGKIPMFVTELTT